MGLVLLPLLVLMVIRMELMLMRVLMLLHPWVWLEVGLLLCGRRGWG